MKLRLFFFCALALLLVHMTTEAATTLRTCSWISPESTPFFVQCMNANFKTIKTNSGLDTPSCFNFGNELTPTFHVCAKKNFKHVSDRLKLNLSVCPVTLDVNVVYIACVQRSFKTIERALK